MEKAKYLIIGAGPTGLGAAYRLKDLGESDFLILDKNDYVGGLAASFKDNAGFTWDIGGHVQFSHYKYFDDVMDRALGVDGWLHHQRESWVWIKDRFVPYPFQNNIRYLPPESAWKCLKGVIEITKNPKKDLPKNFHEWILAVFGDGIADEFMLPYNFKVWAYPPSEMSYQWIGERVSVIDLNRIAENIVLQKDDLSWGPNNLFRFPKFGGTGAIWSSVGKIIGSNKIRLSSQVARIDPNKKIVVLNNGEQIEFEHLLSTIPINLLFQSIDGASKEICNQANQFRYSSSNIVGIGLLGKPKAELSTKCWMYFPEANCPFYRVTLFSKYSPNNVPDINTQFSLMTETSESNVKPVNHDKLIEDTINGLIATKLIESKEQVISTWTYRAEHGYPTPFLQRDALLTKLNSELNQLKIYSRGRFGGWKYEVSNQDHSFMQGVEWVDYISSGKQETTLVI
jgi:protoporphyrinogen oxidase